MFSITTESEGSSAPAKILIQATLNVETTRLESAGRVRSVAAATQRGYLSGSRFLRTNVRKALQM
jgi:hypothetical protein